LRISGGWTRERARVSDCPLLPLEYPDRFEVRYVSANDGIHW